MSAQRVASFAIAPLQQVALDARVLDATLWHALGEQPQLVAESAPAALRGETRFELDLQGVDGCGGAPALCFDFGAGFDAASRVALERAQDSTRPYSATVALAQPPRRIRVDPCAQPGHFLCSELRATPLAEGASAPRARVGAIVHLTDGALWPQMAQYLGAIPQLERLYACIPEGIAPEIAETIASSRERVVLRRLGTGEDGALAAMQMLDLAVSDGIEIVCVAHSRPSAHVQRIEAGRYDVSHKLLGSPDIVAGILEAFRRDPELGVIGPAGHVLPQAYARGMDARMQEWRTRLGLDTAVDPGDFVAGGMYWARVAALRPLSRLGLGDADLRAPNAGAVGNAVEQSPSLAAWLRGFGLAETPVRDSAPRTALDFTASAFLDAALARSPDPTPAGRALVLSPLRGVEAVDAAKGSWRAIDNDPQFLIEGLGAGAGWALARLRLEAPFSAQQPTIYFDFGSGWTNAGCAVLVRPSPDGVSETVCHLPPGVQRARLDPVASPGPFVLEGLDLVPLTTVRAAERMWWAMREAPASRALLSLDRLFPHYVATNARFDDSYANWIRQYEVPRADYGRLAQAQASWPRPPVISIVAPAGAAAAIESVKAQLYPHWELLEGDAEAALARAKGSLFAVLDADTLLHPLALHFVAAAAIGHPGCALVYTDEDRIGADGARRDPLFKCAVNPELLLATDMVGSLACHRTELVRRLGGLRAGFEGARGYDLTLRVVAAESGEAVHVPRVLCHRRDAASTSAASAALARAAVASHLEHTKQAAEVMPAPDDPALRRVRFALPQPLPTVAIVIPTRDRAELLKTCVDSVVARTTYPAYSIVIVDNGSREEATRALLESYRAKGITVMRDDSPFNFSALNNKAVATVAADFVCLLNNDVEVITPGWLEEMVSLAARPGVGAVGARLWFPDRRLQHGGLVLGIAGFAGYSHKLLPPGEPGYASRAVLHQAFSAVTGACLVVRKSLYQQVGGLDERLPVAFNDVDFCLRLREAGCRNLWTPYAELVHDESSSRGPESTPQKAQRLHADMEVMRGRWGERLYDDPYYSPNLTLDAEDFSLAWPPRVTL